MDGFYYLKTTPFEDEDYGAVIEFICSCNWFILMTECAPHMLHPVALFMMLHSEHCIEDDFTNAMHFQISCNCANYLNTMKGKDLCYMQLGYHETQSNSVEE